MPTYVEEIPDDEVVAASEPDLDDTRPDDDDAPELEISEDDDQFFDEITKRILLFTEEFTGIALFPYQREPAYRLIYSVIANDGAEITLLTARQSGKTELLANVAASLMVILPLLAKAYPQRLARFSRGLMIGVFGPIDEQSINLHSRIVDRLTSERATEWMLDPEINDRVDPKNRGKLLRLKNSGSLARRQTAHATAKIEGTSYHLVLIDECQDADDYMIKKSIKPMLAFYNGTTVLAGTPNRQKGYFWRAIHANRRVDSRRRSHRCNHYQYDYKTVIKYNPDYKRYIATQKSRYGEESDEFQMSYCCRWLLERGMFLDEDAFEALGDRSMETYRIWWDSPLVVGIDPARTKDSTVVTVMYVDWDNPDPFGFYPVRVLNWLEINNEEWEEQYQQIWEFLSYYNVWRIAVDSSGMGDAVADRLKVMFATRNVEVVPMPSHSSEQSKRWLHMLELIQRKLFRYPARTDVRKTRKYKRFFQQMTDLQKKYQGPYLMAEAPNEPEAHDDFPDSAALACFLTVDEALMPEVEVTESPFVGRNRH